ncbi:hypothetical protein IE81DRAFT_77042 [Ceraceosorus guamensis]|uniref:Uncharacterized protein n=1 Tax=Ceraceosorus guamensis TaxID=1522189 RepID=A0A316W657_9BASI|nr:hypothetical protein IE81DRAFT_77042 [Ceraceosorus guamensis]PWN43513.1 hypothetical protein IE81DRAFT_77042 [Ceraceosorus guamensis]
MLPAAMDASSRHSCMGCCAATSSSMHFGCQQAVTAVASAGCDESKPAACVRVLDALLRRHNVWLRILGLAAVGCASLLATRHILQSRVQCGCRNPQERVPYRSVKIGTLQSQAGIHRSINEINFHRQHHRSDGRNFLVILTSAAAESQCLPKCPHCEHKTPGFRLAEDAALKRMR